MEPMYFVPEGPAVSLQLLIITGSASDRGQKISGPMYRHGVLEGNWLENSAKISCLAKDEWTTLYEASYRPYSNKLLIRSKFQAWEQKLLTQGIGARLMINHHRTKYHDNWTTSYDLSFKILPKGLCGPQLRQFNTSKKEWLPAQDYSNIYGNLTNYGLTYLMKQKWENKPICSLWTNYQDDFPEYNNASSLR